MLGGRSLDLILRNVGRRENWVQLGRMRRVYPDFTDSLRRYFTGTGSYPHRQAVRVPGGVVEPTLHSSHDFVTVNEVFCRMDYRAPAGVRTVVDVGANIGITALYYLSLGPQVRVHCYEPVPRNVERLRENLAGYEDRYTLTEAAVWDRSGTVDFGLEHTGRYGGIGQASETTIAVPCLHIDEALRTALEHADRVDVLKVDTEGAEIATVAAIAPELLDRIGVIYFETEERPVLHAGRFRTTYAADTARMAHF